MRQAMVGTTGSPSPLSRFQRASGWTRTVHAPGTGSQRYSSSLKPSSPAQSMNQDVCSCAFRGASTAAEHTRPTPLASLGDDPPDLLLRTGSRPELLRAAPPAER